MTEPVHEQQPELDLDLNPFELEADQQVSDLEPAKVTLDYPGDVDRQDDDA